jgi:hypothetical protein
MDQKSILVASDVASGVVALVMTKLQNSSSNAMIWKPFVEATVLSVIGRMGENYLAGGMFSRADKDANTKGTPYLRTESGRSSTIIALASYIYSYIMKSKNPWIHVLTNVSSDVLGNEIISSFLSNDTILISGKQ